MSTKIEDLLEAEAEAAEAAEATSDPGAPLPAHVKVTRGTARSKNLQVRFRDEEFDELAVYADGHAHARRWTNRQKRAVRDPPRPEGETLPVCGPNSPAR